MKLLKKSLNSLNIIMAEAQHLNASSGCVRCSAMYTIISTILRDYSTWDRFNISELDLFKIRRLKANIDIWVNDSNTDLSLIFNDATYVQLIKTIQETINGKVQM